MKRPAWLIIVAGVTLILGVLGMLGSADNLRFLRTMGSPQALLATLQQELHAQKDAQQTSEEQAAAGDEVATKETTISIEALQRMMELPEWYWTWSHASALLAATIAIMYLVTVVFLLRLKPMGIVLLYVSATSSIGLKIIQIIMTSKAFPANASGPAAGDIVWLAINITLIITASLANKDAFRPKAIGP